MAIFPEEKLRAKRQLTERAISLAMASRWEEAAQVNRDLLALFPDDVDAHNRLGKANTELGSFEEAKASYARAAELDPTNVIAMKNIQRLAKLIAESATVVSPTRVDPSLFIEESGKTTITTLVNPAGPDTLAKMTAGDLLELSPSKHSVQVLNPAGQLIGQIEPKLGKRLLSLLQGGNRYQTAVTSVDEHSVRVIIREIHKSPNMAGKVSFPSKPAGEFRGYIKDSVLKYELDDEEDMLEEGEEGVEPTPETDMTIEEPIEESELPDV